MQPSAATQQANGVRQNTPLAVTKSLVFVPYVPFVPYVLFVDVPPCLPIKDEKDVRDERDEQDSKSFFDAGWPC